MKKQTKEELEIYWKGFFNGRKNALKHNINLMKLQLKVKNETSK